MYSLVKEEIKDIISIVKECPESLQEKCFEILLNNLLKETCFDSKKSEPVKDIKNEEYTDNGQVITNYNEDKNTGECEIELKDFHVKTRKFIESSGITCTDLNSIYYKDGSKIIPLYEELGTNKMAESQMRIALLTAFENSIENDGEMFFDGEIVRKRCQDLKCYDGANFAANFKKNSSLFDDLEKYEKGKDIRLSIEGKKELAKVILILSRGE
jgi:hypothetical protein